MEGVRLNHSCGIVVVNYSYGGLGGKGMEVVVGNHAEQSQELVACWEIPDHF